MFVAAVSMVASCLCHRCGCSLLSWGGVVVVCFIVVAGAAVFVAVVDMLVVMCVAVACQCDRGGCSD